MKHFVQRWHSEQLRLWREKKKVCISVLPKQSIFSGNILLLYMSCYSVVIKPLKQWIFCSNISPMLSKPMGPVLPIHKPYAIPTLHELSQKFSGLQIPLQRFQKSLSSECDLPLTAHLMEMGCWVLLTQGRCPSTSQRSPVNLPKDSEFGNLSFPLKMLSVLSGRRQLCSGCVSLFCPFHLKRFFEACSTSAHEEITLSCCFPLNFRSRKGCTPAQNMP